MSKSEKRWFLVFLVVSPVFFFMCFAGIAQVPTSGSDVVLEAKVVSRRSGAHWVVPRYYYSSGGTYTRFENNGVDIVGVAPAGLQGEWVHIRCKDMTSLLERIPFALGLTSTPPEAKWYKAIETL